jgi:hypothetical protein
MTMESPRTTKWAVRAIPFETVSTNLDAELRTQLDRAEQAAIIRENTALQPPEIAATVAS